MPFSLYNEQLKHLPEISPMDRVPVIQKFEINKSSAYVFAVYDCPSWHVQGHHCFFVDITVTVNHTFLSSK
jgi:hypothetical protein